MNTIMQEQISLALDQMRQMDRLVSWQKIEDYKTRVLSLSGK